MFFDSVANVILSRFYVGAVLQTTLFSLILSAFNKTMLSTTRLGLFPLTAVVFSPLFGSDSKRLSQQDHFQNGFSVLVLFHLYF